MPFSARPLIDLLAASLEPTDGIAKRPRELAHDFHEQVEMIGHHRAVNRLKPRRKRAHFLEVLEDRPPERAENHLGLNLLGLKPKRPRLVDRKPRFCARELARCRVRSDCRACGASRGLLYHQLAEFALAPIGHHERDHVVTRPPVIPAPQAPPHVRLELAHEPPLLIKHPPGRNKGRRCGSAITIARTQPGDYRLLGIFCTALELFLSIGHRSNYTRIPRRKATEEPQPRARHSM